MKKLIPALCMLLVAAALMGTSTYAWFSMNTQVTATGMQVKATTSKNLLIKGEADTEYTPIGTQDSDTKALTPVSVNCPTTENLSTKTFYKANSEGVDVASGVLTSGKTELSTATANAEYRKSTFSLKVDGDTEDKFSNIYVSGITVAKTDGNALASDISKAIRVAVSCTNGSTSYTYIFAPNGGSYTDGKSVSGFTAKVGDTPSSITLAAQAISTVGTASTLGSLAGGATLDVDVYVWYEGNDTECTTANAVSVESLKVVVEFAGAVS